MGEMLENVDCFKKGAFVEVSLEDEGFRGSWYTGSVLRTVSKRSKKILVEFQTLMADKKSGSKPLRQFVDFILVRPVPPRESKRRFNLNEEVDAFHNDGWWEGVITGVSPSSSDGDELVRYSVFFRSSSEQIEFPPADLRLHREWVYGNWVPPLPHTAQPHLPTQ